MHVFHHLDQLTILLIAEIVCNRHPITQLPGKREYLVVDDQCAGKVNTMKNIQVFVVGVTAFIRYSLAVLAKESMLDEFSCWINLVDDRIGVPIKACSKDGNLVIGVSGSKALK